MGRGLGGFRSPNAPLDAALAIAAGDHQAALAGLGALCENERDPHHRIPLHGAIARWRSRLDGVTSADEVHARIASGRRDMEDARCTRCGLEFIRAASESLARVGDVAEAVRWFEEAEHAPPRGDLQAWDHLRARSALAAAGRGDRASLQEAIDTADRLGMGIESIWARTSLALVKAGETLKSRIDTAVVDIATLTGAMVIALGHIACGVFSNSDTLAAWKCWRASNRSSGGREFRAWSQ